MKPVIISIIIGIAIVIVAAGFLSRDIPMEKMIPDNYETQTPIMPNIPIGEDESNFSTNPATADICDKSYPDICIAPYPPDVDCDEIGFSNFRVYQPDPHGLDADYDGIGCEVGSPESANPVETVSNCDPSYPDVCIEQYPPDLNCGDIAYSNFKVIGADPHGFDRDRDGIGCES